MKYKVDLVDYLPGGTVRRNGRGPSDLEWGRVAEVPLVRSSSVVVVNGPINVIVDSLTTIETKSGRKDDR